MSVKLLALCLNYCIPICTLCLLHYCTNRCTM
nr:MAG TPA: Smc4, Condensin complex subunit 2, SMC complex, ATPase, chromosome [Caudoviricetes sp.]